MSDDRARTRFFIIQSHRLLGLLLVLLGILVVYGRIDLPEEAGYVLIAIGIVDALVLPGIFARRWRTPPR